MDKFGFALSIILAGSCFFLGIISIFKGENIPIISAFFLSSCMYFRIAYDYYKNKDK